MMAWTPFVLAMRSLLAMEPPRFQRAQPKGIGTPKLNEMVVRNEDTREETGLEMPTTYRRSRRTILTGIVLQVGIGREVFHRIYDCFEAMVFSYKLLVLVRFIEI